MTPLGEIKCVFYLHGEHDAVLVAKKGFAALLSSKLQKAVSMQDIILSITNFKFCLPFDNDRFYMFTLWFLKTILKIKMFISQMYIVGKYIIYLYSFRNRYGKVRLCQIFMA
jgi:hypothetical protein